MQKSQVINMRYKVFYAPHFVSEDDNPRILNTDLADSKIDRKTNYKLEIKVTPVH